MTPGAALWTESQFIRAVVAAGRADAPPEGAKVAAMARVTEALCERASERAVRVAGRYSVVRGRR